MIQRIFFLSFLSGLIFFNSALGLFAQTKPLIKRTTYKSETVEFAAGGMISVIGAPHGSIEIEGWEKSEVEIYAEISAEAETEDDLNLLSKVNGFVLENSPTHLRILSVGTHDRRGVYRAIKDFPKQLLETPFRIDYHIKVPLFSNLDVVGGKGEFNLSNVEGASVIKYLETDANINLNGGSINAVFGNGTINFLINSANRREQNSDIQLARGVLNITLPLNLNADLKAKILRTGKIENTYKFLSSSGQTRVTAKSITAKTGSGGGAALSFTVGDGNISLSQTKTSTAQISN